MTEHDFQCWNGQTFEFIAKAQSIIFVQIDRQGFIVWANLGFTRAAGITGPVKGLRAADYLQNESGEPHPSVAEPVESDDNKFLARTDFRDEIFSCSLLKVENGFLIIGEALRLSDSSIMEKMSLLMNESNRFSRELKNKNSILKRLNKEKEELIDKLMKARNQIKTLSGLIPICSNCKNIRDDQGFWQRVEKYVTDNSDAEFSHGICPECIRKLYPEIADEVISKSESASEHR